MLWAWAFFGWCCRKFRWTMMMIKDLIFHGNFVGYLIIFVDIMEYTTKIYKKTLRSPISVNIIANPSSNSPFYQQTSPINLNKIFFFHSISLHSLLKFPVVNIDQKQLWINSWCKFSITLFQQSSKGKWKWTKEEQKNREKKTCPEEIKC